MSSADVQVKLAEYDHDLARITERDREYAEDCLGDLGLPDNPPDVEQHRTVTEWFRKVRYEAVIEDRKKRSNP